jgi:hypothetical protein
MTLRCVWETFSAYQRYKFLNVINIKKEMGNISQEESWRVNLARQLFLMSGRLLINVSTLLLETKKERPTKSCKSLIIV